MNIQVRARRLDLPPATREQVDRRLHYALSRFGTLLRSVKVFLSDMNGPRGGVDKLCRITIHGQALRPVVVEGLAPSLYAAIDVAADRAAHAVARRVEHKRQRRQQQGFAPHGTEGEE